MSFLIWIFSVLVSLGYGGIPNQHNCKQADGSTIVKCDFDGNCKESCYEFVNSADAKQFLDDNGISDQLSGN